MSASAFHVTRTSTGIRVWFTVLNADRTLRTGLVAGNFTVTLIRDDDGATNTPSVTESTQLSGAYYFDVPSAFLTTNGNNYFMIIQVTLTPVDVVSAPLFVSQRLWDQLAQAGDAMDLVTDAVDADAVATSGANEIRDTILSDATPFAGANIDAAISTRATQAQILSDATPFAGANIDATISSRSDFNEATDPVELLDAGGTAGTSAAELVADIDAELTTQHGAGSWQSASASDWTTTEREQIRGALGVVGTQASPAGGGELQDILADTAAMQPTVATNLDATVSSRAQPGDAMAMTAPAETQLVDAVWDEVLTGLTHNIVNSAGRKLRELRNGVVSVSGVVVDATPAAGDFDTDLIAGDNGFYNDHVLVFTNGALSGQSKPITAYLTANGNVTFDEPFTSAPANGDEFVILAYHVHPLTQIAAAVDAELTTNHGAGSWVGVALTTTQDDRLRELWQMRGLDIANIAELKKAEIGTPGYIRIPVAGTSIDVEVTQVDATTVRLARQ